MNFLRKSHAAVKVSPVAAEQLFLKKFITYSVFIGFA